MIDAFFFDSYAIIETIKGNAQYEKFKGSIVVTTKLNLFEVFHILLRNVGQREAEETLEKYYDFIVDYDKAIIKDAAKFKLENKSKNLSMADCIGYKMAQFLGIKFLTGDSQFEHLADVEFVK